MGIFKNKYGNITTRGYITAELGLLTAGLVLIGGCIGGCGTITNRWQRSEGERVGMVNQISKSGFFWKTYEGQMALEGISGSGDSLGANVWDFSIDNYEPSEKQETLVKKLQASMKSGEKVKIKYKHMVETWPWRSGSNYLIQDIEPISGNRTPNSPVNTQSPEKQTPRDAYKAQGELEVSLDNRNYLLRHDKTGKLKVLEVKEVQ